MTKVGWLGCYLPLQLWSDSCRATIFRLVGQLCSYILSKGVTSCQEKEKIFTNVKMAAGRAVISKPGLPREKPSTVLCMLPPIMRCARKEARQWQTLSQTLCYRTAYWWDLCTAVGGYFSDRGLYLCPPDYAAASDQWFRQYQNHGKDFYSQKQMFYTDHSSAGKPGTADRQGISGQIGVCAGLRRREICGTQSHAVHRLRSGPGCCLPGSTFS